MDKFAEQLVKKYPSSSETLKKTLIVVAAVIGCIVAVLFCVTLPKLSPVFILFAIGVIYGAFWLINSMYTEYEYEVTNGDLDISKIIAKKKRSDLLSVKVSDFTSLSEYDENNFTEDDNMTRYHCSDGTINHLFYADFSDEDGEKCRLYFSPSVSIIEAMLPFLKPQIKEDIKALLEKQIKEETASEEENSDETEE